jgi:hypothetical protein
MKLQHITVVKIIVTKNQTNLYELNNSISRKSRKMHQMGSVGPA